MDEVEKKLEKMKSLLGDKKEIDKKISALAEELSGCGISRELVKKYGLKMTHDLVDDVTDDIEVVEKVKDGQ